MHFLVPLLLNLPSPAAAAEIDVSLFEQLCQLSGPVDESTLRAIHAINPEKLPTPESPDEARRTLATLRGLPKTPPELDRYRESLLKRLETLQVFHEALAGAQRAGKTAPLLSAVKPRVDARRFQEFRSSLGKLVPSAGKWSPAAVTAIKELLKQVAPPDPEDEFHRATRRLRVSYSCNLDDPHAHDDDEGDEPQSEPSAGPSPSPEPPRPTSSSTA